MQPVCQEIGHKCKKDVCNVQCGVYCAVPINQTCAGKQSEHFPAGPEALSGQLQSGQCVFKSLHTTLLPFEAENKLVDLFQWTSGKNTLKPRAAICHGAVVVMIKYQSSALCSFPNYQFHLLHYTAFVEQKVMIHLGDCQVIFFPICYLTLPFCLPSLFLSFAHHLLTRVPSLNFDTHFLMLPLEIK